MTQFLTSGRGVAWVQMPANLQTATHFVTHCMGSESGKTDSKQAGFGHPRPATEQGTALQLRTLTTPVCRWHATTKDVILQTIVLGR